MSGSLNSSSSFIDKIEASLIVDLLTLGILGYIAYFLYTDMNMITQRNILTVPDDPHLLAFQMCVFLIFIYSLEAMHDRVKSSSGHI